MTPQTPEFGWKLERCLAVIDTEATGTNPRADRIVEISIVKLTPDRRLSTHTFRINPGIPIPPETTAIHGITDADVAQCPTFGQRAPELLDLLDGCDLAGYNVIRFDIPLLIEEFFRANITFDVERCRVIDAQRIFHKREPRDLSAALAFYCGSIHVDAHGAEADALATLQVLEGQFRKYPDLPRDMNELDRYCNPRDPSWVDKTGKLRWSNGDIVLNFGRRKGESLRDLVRHEPGFIKWILKNDFPRDLQEVVTNATQGKWPDPPAKDTVGEPTA